LSPVVASRLPFNSTSGRTQLTSAVH
jgi:hypothetical protein